MNKEKINRLLRKLNVELHGVSYIQALRKGEFKSNEFSFFRNNIKKDNPVIFDVGANHGLIIEKFLKDFPQATIYAFEPVPHLCSELKAKYMNNKLLQISDHAISDYEGVSDFFVNKGVDTSSILSPRKTGLNSDESVQISQKITVTTTSIDKFCESQSIEKIDILKMDIQGNELKALLGAKNLLKSHRISIIYLETYFIQQYNSQPLFSEIFSFLNSYDYALQDLYNPIYGHGRIAWCDSVFVRRER